VIEVAVLIGLGTAVLAACVGIGIVVWLAGPAIADAADSVEATEGNERECRRHAPTQE
jgi:hypothetical protein